jgi:hypothetical protein
MPLRPLRRATVVGGLVAALAVPASSYGAVLSHADPAQDAQKITTSGGSMTITKAPDNKTADIVHLGVRYGARRFKETVRLRDLGRHWFVTSRIRTPAGRFDLALVHRAGQNTVTLTHGKGRVVVACDGLLEEVDGTRHTASMTVPADCLSAPAWVRVGTGIVTFGKPAGVKYGDDALRKHGIAEADLTLSRKVHQG